MFKRDRNIDIVKTQAKVLDPKRDSFNRLKHLRIFLDHVENQEAKEFFTTNYSPVFFIFHDAFSIVESNIRIKGVHKSQREEFEQVRFLLEKILTLLPELLAEGWQGHSIRVIMKKMLHHGNSFKMLCEGIRLFIIWYQALREAAPVEVDQMFSQLVPFATPIPVASSCQRSAAECGLEESTASASQNKDAIFYIVPENEPGAVVASEYNLMFPPVPGEPQPDDMSSALLEYLLQTMVTQVTKIQWARLVVNGVRQYERCFSFLLERFRVVYIPYLFPNMSPSMYSLYNPNLDLPAAVRSDSVLLSRPQSVVLTWLVSHVTPVRDEREAGATRNAQRMDSSLTFYAAKIAWSSQMVVEDDIVRMVSILPRSDFLTIVHRAVARNVLFATPGNVDFVHEMFRQCLVSPLGQTLTTKKIIAVYREWIQMTHPDPPSFLVEQPFADQPKNPVYCGQQNLYKVFMTNASNFFLLSLPPGESQLLAEQVDLCKRVMNIYRFMVMKKLMERPTWEQLLYVILHVTSQVLSHDSPKKAVSGSSVGVSGVQAVSQVSGGAMISCTYGGETLGQQLAAALFQTLIVTWIKANLHATICVDLWNGFVRVLSSLAHWEPLVDEWAKTMKTLTRILTTRVYGLDLDNLPLDRLSEQQSKRRRALGGATKFGGRLSQDVDNSGMAGQVLGHVGSATCGGLPIGSRGNRGHLIDAEGAHKTSLIQHGRRAGASPTDMLSRTGCSSAGGMSGGISAASSLLRRMSDSHVLLHRRLEFRQRACHSCTAWPNRALVRSFSQQAIWNGNISSSGTNVSSFQLQGVVICALHQELSASPAASSSVLESSSIKEQQLMNHMMDCASSDNGGESAGETDGRSVLAGGTRKGWCPEVAAVLWRRMLCCLGNVNQIADPGIHAKVIDQLSQLCDTLIKVRENQGVCEDGSVSAVPPSFIPPVHLLCPWLFDATQLGDEYEKGRLTAYTLLCDLALRWHDIPLSAEFVTRFYDVLHRGLWVGASWKLRQNLVRVAGCRFFGARLPGFTLLALDFTRAAADILSQPTLKATPRSEAVRCLGSLMFLGNLYGELSALDPTQAPTAAKQPSKPLQVIPLTNLEEEVVASLMRAASSDPDWQARCTALCAISVWIYQQLLCRSYHGKVIPALIVLLQSLQPSSTVCSQQKSAAVKLLVASKCGQYTVCQTAAECLALLAEFAPALLKDIPHLPEVIVKSLSSVVCQLFPSSSGQQDINEGLATLITSLMFCLAEWLMAVPQDELTGGPVPSSLHCALSALDGVIRGSPRSSDIARGPSIDELLTKLSHRAQQSSSPEAESAVATACAVASSKQHSLLSTSLSDPPLYDANQHAATLLQADATEQLGPSSSLSNNVRLAAKAILCHVLNNVGHFPMNSLSLSSPSSLTIENDDVAPMPPAGVETVQLNTSGQHLGSSRSLGETSIGPACVATTAALAAATQAELSRSTFTAPNIQFFTLNDSAIVSFVEIPPNADKMSDLTEGKARTRVIVRDVCGKFSWECVTLYGPLGCRAGSFPPGPSPDPCAFYSGPRLAPISDEVPDRSKTEHQQLNRPTASNGCNPKSAGAVSDAPVDGCHSGTITSHEWPRGTFQDDDSVLHDSCRDDTLNCNEDAKDNLDQVLAYIGATSPECTHHLDQPLNAPSKALNQQSSLAEADQINEVLAFAEAESAMVAEALWSPRQRSLPMVAPSETSILFGADCQTLTNHSGTHCPQQHTAVFDSQEPQHAHTSLAPFQYSRLLLDQLNMLSWERRSSIALLQKNDKLLRELRYLDQQRSRETHKIAVIYVQAGQEDKNSILMNQCGSPEFEAFVSGLGWDVDLRIHPGYRGGLDAHGSTGLTAPYYADSFVEVLFHVSTRIPAHEKDAMTKKLRHLGNDEVHVVWSEHAKEYRRGIIATEFGDVFIVLYPLPDGLCRVQINSKPDVPFFGPLFDGAIVDQRVLPALVRATAISADRAVNSLKLMFRSYYEVRSSLIENICTNFKEPTTFEEFACKVFQPGAPRSGPGTSGSVSSQGANVSLTSSNTAQQTHLSGVYTSLKDSMTGNSQATMPNASYEYSSPAAVSSVLSGHTNDGSETSALVNSGLSLTSSPQAPPRAHHTQHASLLQHVGIGHRNDQGGGEPGAGPGGVSHVSDNSASNASTCN